MRLIQLRSPTMCVPSGNKLNQPQGSTEATGDSNALTSGIPAPRAVSTCRQETSQRNQETSQRNDLRRATPEPEKAQPDQRTTHCVHAHMHSRRLLKKCCWLLEMMEMIASIPKLPLFFVFRDHNGHARHLPLRRTREQEGQSPRDVDCRGQTTQRRTRQRKVAEYVQQGRGRRGERSFAVHRSVLAASSPSSTSGLPGRFSFQF